MIVIALLSERGKRRCIMSSDATLISCVRYDTLKPHFQTQLSVKYDRAYHGG
jgi:hypothetical protein